MNKMNDAIASPWKQYTILVLESWLAFCIATFAMGVYFTHLNAAAWITAESILMIVAYVFVIIICIQRLIRQLPIAVFMILVPIAPLAVLILVVSLLPIIQQLR